MYFHSVSDKHVTSFVTHMREVAELTGERSIRFLYIKNSLLRGASSWQFGIYRIQMGKKKISGQCQCCREMNLNNADYECVSSSAMPRVSREKGTKLWRFFLTFWVSSLYFSPTSPMLSYLNKQNMIISQIIQFKTIHIYVPNRL